MRLLLSSIFIFIATLVACGDNNSDDSNDLAPTDPNTFEPIITNDKIFPYGTWQSVCVSFAIYTNVPAYENMGVILTEKYDKEFKTFIETAYAFEKVGNNLCSIPLFKLEYSYTFDSIIYNSKKDLYTTKLTFIKATATPGSTDVATNWNNNNHMGINTWSDRVERDITGKNADGSSFIPEPFSYKIIGLQNSNTQLIQNESTSGYPTSLDYGYVFFKHD